MAVITISRELGSEGDHIADLVCERLGYQRVDKDVLLGIAADAGVDIEAVREFEQSFTKRARLVSGEMTSLYRKQASAFEKATTLDGHTYAQVLRETVEDFARQDNVVLVGRGGQILLRDWPNAIHVRIYAPPEVRAQRVAEREGQPLAAARRAVRQSDEQKRQYIRHMHNNADWRNLKYYHLAIDTSRIDPQTAAEIIVLAAQSIGS